MTSSNEEDETGENAPESEIIIASARISALLKPLENKADHLVLTIPNSDASYTTTLLEVDKENSLLVLDRLSPKDGHGLLIDSRQPTIKISHKGADITFTTTLNNTKPEKIMPRYELNFPESLQYLHRRNTYRVTLRNDNEMSAVITTDNNQSFHGILHNISTEGMCIQFSEEFNISQDSDPAEVQCILTLTDGEELKCGFNVCHTYFNDHSKDYLIGGSFQHLDKTQKRAMEKFVIELQRRAQKTMVR
jgi:c-di-GMP-binding flagellar brake protein YcgR